MGFAGLETTNDLLQDVVAASGDSRARNVRYRQNQLQALHGFCRKNADKICKSINDAEEYTTEEVEMEFYMAMSCISQLYDELDFDAGLYQEYSATRTNDNTSRRIPYGVVLIQPPSRARFYAVIAALSTAVAAGNCAVVQLSNATSSIDTLLRNILDQMDQEAYIAVPEDLKDLSLLSECLVVDQLGSFDTSGYQSIRSTPGALVLAVIDRTADVKLAAKDICNACTAFGGSSDYAPDLILVNEWVKQQFVEACLSELVSLASRSQAWKRQKTDRKDRRVELLPEEHEAATLFDSCGIQLIEQQERAGTIHKRVSRQIRLQTTTGLVDAVTFATKSSQSKLACFHFANAESGKFLSQHIDADMTWINHIPESLLVGPPIPSTSVAPEFPLRYSIEMMSKPSPERILPPKTSLSLHVPGARDRKTRTGVEYSTELRRYATKELKPTGQPSGTSLGFFDQGIITGIVAFVLPTIGCLSVAVFYGVRWGIRQMS